MKRVQKLLVVLFSLNAFSTMAQHISKQDIIDSWNVMAEMVIASAEAMPAEHYGITPIEPLRNFANQINHTTSSNIGLGSMVFGAMPKFSLPDRSNPPQSKSEVIDILKKSFDYVLSNISELDDHMFDESIQWGNPKNPKSISRLKGLLIMHSHLQREQGKTIMYLRQQGIAPPQSQSWVF